MSPRKKKTTRKKSKTVASQATGEDLSTKERVSQKNISGDPFMDNHLLSWEAPEFIYHRKSALWYLITSFLLMAIITSLIFLKEWLAIFVFFLLGILIFKFADIKPRDIKISITNVGIKIGNVFYPFNKLSSFWLVYEPPIKTLNLETTKRFSATVTIQLEGTDPFLVKNILREHLLEESERTEDLIDRISRFLKF